MRVFFAPKRGDAHQFQGLLRFFGNVLGAFVIMELLKLVVPVFVPAVFSLYFDLFDGLIQTYVFVFLTSLFMKETMGGED